MKKLILVDGNSIAFRAFYALPLLTNKSGQFTNAVYGFTMMLMKLMEEEKPSHLFVAFDAGKETFRHKQYAEYKGTRQKTPSELSEQLPVMREVLDAMGIHHYEKKQYEADDIIGTLAHSLKSEAEEVLIVTGDKDLLQLVDDNVTLLMTKKGVTDATRYDRAKIEEQYGLTPDQIRDLKGLMGDSSDNIPGIPGVGEKTALKLLHQFESVESVLDHIDQLPGKKLKEKVAAHQEQARISKELATIYCEVPLELSAQDLRCDEPNHDQLRTLFKKLEFKKLLERLDPESSQPEEESAVHLQEVSYQMVSEIDENLAEWFLQEKLGCVVELSDEHYHHGEVIGMALSDGEKQLYLPCEVMKEWKAFRTWLADGSKEKIVYDAKRTQVSLTRQGFRVNGLSFDIMLAAYLLNPSESEISLSEIMEQHLGGGLPTDEAVYGKGAKRQALQGEALGEHLARKAVVVTQLEELLRTKLKEVELDKLYFDIELPLTDVLARMEQEGIRVDVEGLEALGEELRARLNELTDKIYDLAGTQFNINSPKQMGEVLFDKLGLPVIKKTKTGYSTSADVLEKLAPQHEIVEYILHYRQVGKLISTYIEGLLKVIEKEQSKIHTQFNQAITATGRLSSTNPNLQNIPIRLEEGRRLRRVFVPSKPGWSILAADYSQIELRILANISGDETLIQSFIEERDIHTQTAMDIFGVNEDDVTSLMRSHAKAVNFGIVYGISDYGLSQNLDISRKEAAAIIDKYFSSYPDVKKYLDDVIEKAKKEGYVTTIFQRRRYLPDIHSSNFNRRSFAERTAMNTPIQGSNADIIKKAMVEMDHELRERGLESRMLLQVHDELVFEVPQHEIDTLTQLVKEVMEGTVSLRVPLKVEVSSGSSWYEAK
ncbi:DNA polymerase I [Mechercharimyces sp. CAU 1602]|uniref:DNA polymerase I n=1 Tax=Mechercharimyces sp. CAU 1602 TaxID=2973933 RepID=UPI0021636ACE|nr:DNA polymerase I [Mechercharimyces sp. CAU 1602]MCS1351594.1 DNA polymerase I [Mechercharimyces sp. CAU 1602]